MFHEILISTIIQLLYGLWRILKCFVWVCFLFLPQVCSELEEEKRKHAQDTAQGDDVTYMLEKERERLRQEVLTFKCVCKCNFVFVETWSWGLYLGVYKFFIQLQWINNIASGHFKQKQKSSSKCLTIICIWLLTKWQKLNSACTLHFQYHTHAHTVTHRETETKIRAFPWSQRAAACMVGDACLLVYAGQDCTCKSHPAEGEPLSFGRGMKTNTCTWYMHVLKLTPFHSIIPLLAHIPISTCTHRV